MHSFFFTDPHEFIPVFNRSAPTGSRRAGHCFCSSTWTRCFNERMGVPFSYLALVAYRIALWFFAPPVLFCLHFSLSRFGDPFSRIPFRSVAVCSTFFLHILISCCRKKCSFFFVQIPRHVVSFSFDSPNLFSDHIFFVGFFSFFVRPPSFHWSFFSFNIEEFCLGQISKCIRSNKVWKAERGGEGLACRCFY